MECRNHNLDGFAHDDLPQVEFTPRPGTLPENALDQLKRDAPELWEKATTAIALEEDRLETSGPVSGPTADLLIKEQDRLYEALKGALPTLEANAIRAIAMGQLGTWLIECPLDFTVTTNGALQ